MIFLIVPIYFFFISHIFDMSSPRYQTLITLNQVIFSCFNILFKIYLPIIHQQVTIYYIFILLSDQIDLHFVGPNCKIFSAVFILIKAFICICSGGWWAVVECKLSLILWQRPLPPLFVFGGLQKKSGK
jgi:hypothetical protein